jgi:hypothetical protein
LEECEVELGAAFPADVDAAPVVQPGVGAFHRPALARVGIADSAVALASLPDLARRCAVGDWVAGAAAPADHRLDAALLERGAQRARVVAAVGPYLARASAGGADAVDQRKQIVQLVLVAGGDLDRQRRPAGVDG